MSQVDDEVAELRAECQRLTEALEQAERERLLLAYDVHDAVVQDLTAAAMLLESAGNQAAFPAAELQKSFASSLKLLREGIAAARHVMHGLALVDLEHDGLCAALSRLVEKFRTEFSLPVTLQIPADELSLPPSMQHLLLRIAQESLNNAWKHSRATAVEVALTRREGVVELSIADNGVGFGPASVPPGHLGLEGIRSRARVLGAKLLFDTAPNHGTRVVVEVPLP